MTPRIICHWLLPRWNPHGRYIPYTARQVALRRAARLVCVAVGGIAAAGVPTTLAPAPAPVPWPSQPVGFYVPPAWVVTQVPDVPAQDVPEPAGIAVLGVGVLGLWVGRGKRG